MEKNKGGRPPAEIDLEQLEKLGQLQCTQPELAAFFGVTLRTIEKRLALPEYREAYDKGKGNGLTSLRRAQFRAAVEDKNPTMLVWMGKQLLDQKDKSHNENRSVDAHGNDVTPVTINIKELDDKELEKRLLELTKKT